MKNLLLFILTIFTLTSCSNNDDKPSNPIDQLPEATQTGRGIFACLVDGKPFIDTSGYPNNLNFNCFYQYVDGGYYFSIQGKNPKENMRTVILATTNKSITVGEILQLIENQDNNAWGGGRFNFSDNTTEGSYTNFQYTGELHITKFNLEQQIVSGTFWFDLKNPKTGETVEIREGRFDTGFGL